MARTTEQILQQMLGNQAITIAQQGAHIESLVDKIKELESLIDKSRPIELVKNYDRELLEKES